MNLSGHFVLSEFHRPGEVPPAAVVEALRALCVTILEPMRARYGGRAVAIHSGYRSPARNAAVGGAKSSQHLTGEAVDLHIAGVDCGDVARWLLHSGLPVDQVIAETRNGAPPYTWVHCSYRANGKNRREGLCTVDGRTYKPLV